MCIHVHTTVPYEFVWNRYPATQFIYFWFCSIWDILSSCFLSIYFPVCRLIGILRNASFFGLCCSGHPVEPLQTSVLFGKKEDINLFDFIYLYPHNQNKDYNILIPKKRQQVAIKFWTYCVL